MPRLIPSALYTATATPQTHPKYGVSCAVSALRGDEGEVDAQIALLAMSSTPQQFQKQLLRLYLHVSD